MNLSLKMKTMPTKLLGACLSLLLTAFTSTASDYLPDDYTWTTQSKNSSESMPCGGHDVGMNVWVENGDVLFYISRSGMFDENNTLLKAGRFRLHFSSSPFGNDGKDFSQTLKLSDGAIYIKGKGTSIRIWADVETSAVFAEISSDGKRDATLSYENWRYKDRPLTKAECQQCSYKWVLPKNSMTYKDTVRVSNNVLTFLHRNRDNTVFDFTVDRERLNDIKESLYDPIGGKAFGGEMRATGFAFIGTYNRVYASTDYHAWLFKASKLRKSTISVNLFDGTQAPAMPTASVSKKRSAAWWHDYWQRSNIKLWADNAEENKKAANVARNYELFRYMLGCNAYGKWPTKFNGSLFTFDPVHVDVKTPFTPDYRRWGGGTMTAQNQRLVYWPMLKSGDTDMMVAQFDTYLRLLPAATARTKHYWGHGGASYSEQIENFGLPNPAEYGKHKDGDDYGMERNAWLEYQWDTVLEFCSMILQANRYNGMDIAKYEPMIRESLRFFDEHYRYLAKKRGVKELDGDGKLILYPSSGCETYKMAYNPSSVVAALKTVSEQLDTYYSNKADADTNMTAANREFMKRIPDIPLRTINGDTCIAPAVVWARIQNVETPQLYPVFPWRTYGMGRGGLQTARNTYFKDKHAVDMRTHKGWKQDNIWAACLGLKDEAKRLNMDKFADGPYRFPAFWDPGYDWAPDCNRGGSAMIGLQEMLLQEDANGKLILFPALPDEWNASFKLHATGGRVIEAKRINGKVEVKVITTQEHTKRKK